MKHTFILISALFLLIPCFFSCDNNRVAPEELHSQGASYYYSEDYKAARKYFEKAASFGVVESAYNLGLMYLQGLGVKRDFKKARAWFSKAQNYAEALNWLGLLYENGIGGEQDLEIAVSYYESAICAGSVLAKNNLGKCYLNGWGVEKDYDMAFSLFSEAAEENIEDAFRNLSTMYREGLGREIDIEKSLELDKKAASVGWEQFSEPAIEIDGE